MPKASPIHLPRPARPSFGMWSGGGAVSWVDVWMTDGLDSRLNATALQPMRPNDTSTSVAFPRSSEIASTASGVNRRNCKERRARIPVSTQGKRRAPHTVNQIIHE